jgi:DNA modification methylase
MIELNKIYNEDCLETMTRMESGSVDLVLTDLPYGVNVDYDTFEDTQDNLKELIAKVMPEIKRISKRALITCGTKNLFLFPKPDWTLAWISTAGIGMSKWGFACWQPILAYGNDPYLEMRKGSMPDIFMSNETSDKNGHPCPKPYKLWRKVMLRGSVKQTDVIYDPFMGSGTTALVCEDQNRNWIGSELSKNYCDIANKRLENYRAQGALALTT